MDNKKIMGNSVATTMPFPDVPTKISDLYDDTTDNMIANSHWSQMSVEAQKAWKDGLERSIDGTYATKAELTEAIGEALEGDY